MIKRGNIKSCKVYIKENGKMVTKYSVQVRLRNKQDWIQARKGEEQLIFMTPEEANKVVIDYVEEIKKSMNDKIKEGKVKLKMERKIK